MIRPTDVKVALAQFCTEPYNPEVNRRRACEAIREAFAQDANVVVLPELAVPGYALDRRRLESVAEPLDGPTVAAFSRAAKAAGGYVVSGICERSDDVLYNAAIIVGPDGILAHYRKLHLFDLEKKVFAPGDMGLPLVDLEFGWCGLCMCYDLRFVEVVRLLALRGAQLICVPTAWVSGFDARDPGPDSICQQARGALLQANLDQVFLACASQAGTNEEFRFLGNSLLANPFGIAVAGPMGPEETGLLFCVISLGEVAKAQVRSPLIRPREDRRDDVYGVCYGDKRY